MALTKQETTELLEHNETVVRTLIARYRILELQAAQKGISSPPEILTEMSFLMEQIHVHEKEINELKILIAPTEKISILYVEDLPEHAERYKKVLHAHFGIERVKHVVTARKAIVELNDNPPSILVADLYIPPGMNYIIPVEAEGLPRIGGNYAYGTDICAVALKKGVPVVAISTAPVRHIVRDPIEQARRKYGGTVCHLHKKDLPDEAQLVSMILQCCHASAEIDALVKELRYWLEDRWSDAPDLSTRLAILNEVQMCIESASKPTITALQANPAGYFLQNLLNIYTPENDQERMAFEQIRQIIS